MAAELSVVTEPLPKSQVGMTIEVPTEVVDATYERVLNRLASRAKIEGFRPGRAPRALVEARLGPAVLREEVVEAMVMKRSPAWAVPAKAVRISAAARKIRLESVTMSIHL